jgi:hypothetical protein
MYFLCGLRTNHQPHAELVGALGELAQGPVSLTTASAVLTSMPSMRLRSTPHILYSLLRRSNLGALRARLR